MIVAAGDAHGSIGFFRADHDLDKEEEEEEGEGKEEEEEEEEEGEEEEKEEKGKKEFEKRGVFKGRVADGAFSNLKVFLFLFLFFFDGEQIHFCERFVEFEILFSHFWIVP